MKKRTGFTKLIQLWGIIFLTGIGVSIVAIDVIGDYHDLYFRTEQMRTDYIAHQKQIIKQEVNRVVDLITYEKSQKEILTRKKIKARVYEAYSIAQNIYQQNKTAKSKAKIQTMILDALRPIRFENKSGYYFATRLDGVEMLFADKPEMEGLNLLNLQDTHGRYVIKDMIKIIKQSGEGFYGYHWTKPNSEGNDFKKISFVKRFEPYNWFIGTGLYVDDVEAQIKAHLLSIISRIRFGKEGYIFINRFNGDALVSNGKLFSGTKKLWEVFNKNPEKMKDIFEREYNVALKPEGDYVYYSHIKLTHPGKESPKASFIYGIPDLQWFVGAGVYLDDVETDIALMQTELTHQIKAKILYFILIVMGIVALFILFFNWLNRGLKDDFNLFISFFNKAAHSDEKIEREHIKFVELDQMAKYANKMLTDRRQAEQELRESETRLRTIFDVSKAGIILVNSQGIITYANQGMAKMFGCTPAELMGSSYPEHVHPDHRETGDQRMRQLITGEIDSVAFERHYIRLDGTDFWGFLSGRRHEDDQGNLISLVGIIADITDRKTLEKELRQAYKMESIGTLTGGVAHDFNNIMAIIVGNTELAMDDVPERNPAYSNLEEIKKAGLRATSIVKQLLSFSRKTDQKLQPVKIGVVIQDALKFLRSTIPTTIDIQQNIQAMDETILADPTQISQIMMNLCINASHAMEQNGGNLTVNVKTVILDDHSAKKYFDLKKGRHVKITVSDTGPGIDSAIIHRIFDPYFTTKEVGKGSGMGLAVVHGIVKNYHGAIFVDSKPGKGALFTIYFPVSTEKPKIEKDAIEILPPGSETVLFVDDDKSIVKMVKKILERLGYKVETAMTPDNALKMFGSNPYHYDLVITDMTMPQMTGIKLSEKIIKIRPDIPIIICTGHSALVDEEKVKELELAAYVMKPINKREISHTIRKVLDNK